MQNKHLTHNALHECERVFTDAGERMSAQDAEKAGLVSKVFPPGEVVDEAVKLGEKIGQFSQIATAMAKEAVNMSNELALTQVTN